MCQYYCMKDMISQFPGLPMHYYFPDHVMTRDEVAKMLGCSTKTVTRYGQSGIIRPLKFGANRRKAFGYSAQSVQAAIHSGAMA